MEGINYSVAWRLLDSESSKDVSKEVYGVKLRELQVTDHVAGGGGGGGGRGGLAKR